MDTGNRIIVIEEGTYGSVIGVSDILYVAIKGKMWLIDERDVGVLVALAVAAVVQCNRGIRGISSRCISYNSILDVTEECLYPLVSVAFTRCQEQNPWGNNQCYSCFIFENAQI